jgi:regulator of sigma E protease
LSAEVVILTIIVFFLIIGCHEWGHFFFAKRAGILVREFAIGFGPKLFSVKKNETRYTLRLLPAGGFVRMAGEDPEAVDIQTGQTIAVRVENGEVIRLYVDKLDQRMGVVKGTVEHIDLEHKLSVTLDVDGEAQTYQVHPRAEIVRMGKEEQIAPWDRQFASKTVGQRSMTIFAGPLMNFVLAVLLFFAFVYLNGVPVENPAYLQIGHVVEDSPAEKAGLKENDIVYEVNGERIGADSDELIGIIAASPNQEMKWIVIRDGKHMPLTVTPELKEGKGVIGIHIAKPTRTPSFGEAVGLTKDMIVTSTEQIFIGLKMLVTLQFTLDDLGGPVRIVEFTGEAASMGINTLVYWTALLSLYLGIFNLLPFPALDGSRLVFLGLEAVRGKPIDPSKESMVHFIGFAMLMLLMLAVTYNDILRLFNG